MVQVTENLVVGFINPSVSILRVVISGSKYVIYTAINVLHLSVERHYRLSLSFLVILEKPQFRASGAAGGHFSCDRHWYKWRHLRDSGSDT